MEGPTDQPMNNSIYEVELTNYFLILWIPKKDFEKKASSWGGDGFPALEANRVKQFNMLAQRGFYNSPISESGLQLISFFKS